MTLSPAQDLLRKSDAQAERLIAVLRMGLSAALFAGVSALLAQLDSTGLSARQIELIWLLIGAAAYFCLGVATLWLSDPRRLQPWHPWMLNMLEVALLGFQLWIDVRDPTTPSLLALASPLLLVAALVLAVQALRFDLRLHMATLVVLITLCAAVTFHDPQLGTEWSVAATSELRVLYSPPPNVMRIMILLTLGIVVAAAIWRARRLVLRVAREVEDAENRKRFLPSELAPHLSDAALAELKTPQRRAIAVAMIDIRGFTELTATLGAARTAEVLRAFRSAVLDAVTQNGGIVDKFIGDGAMIIFGLHSAPQQAVRSAQAAVTAILAAPLPGGARPVAALHAGEALVGVFGDDRRLEFTALGQTVNIAARLEDVAKAQGAAFVISAEALDIGALDPGAWTPLGQHTLRGVEAPLDVFQSAAQAQHT